MQMKKIILLILLAIFLTGCTPKTDGELILGNWYYKTTTGIVASKMMSFYDNGTMFFQHTRGIPALYDYEILEGNILKLTRKNEIIENKYAFVDDGVQGEIKILLKYNDDLINAIQGIEKVSTPGRRQYTNVKDMPKVLNGMGINIISTSKGVMTDNECRKMKVGGEIIGKVW